MLLPSGNPIKYHEEVLLLQPMILPKCFDIFSPPDWGMLRRSRCVQVFLFTINAKFYLAICGYIYFYTADGLDVSCRES